jgi:hypothetical protein
MVAVCWLVNDRASQLCPVVDLYARVPVGQFQKPFWQTDAPVRIIGVFTVFPGNTTRLESGNHFRAENKYRDGDPCKNIRANPRHRSSGGGAG